MSLNKTLFLGIDGNENPKFDYDQIVERHSVLRDTIATTLAGDPDAHQNLWGFVALNSFSYLFNGYKAIGLLLPDYYHESACVILRQMWEISLNLHWIEKSPEQRAQDFCNFTIMELRKAEEKQHGKQSLEGFDKATQRFQSRFHFTTRKGKAGVYDNFSSESIRNRAEELGGSWQRDYQLIYNLLSMHAHGAPGAVLQQHFVQHSSSPEVRERDSTALTAYLSMKIIVQDIHLLVREGFVVDSEQIDSVFEGVLNPPSGKSD